MNNTKSKLFNTNENPLLRLHFRKLIDDEQFLAGEQLRVDYERAQLGQRVTMSYGEGGITGSAWQRMSDNRISILHDNAIAARENVARALDAVGPELSGMLLHVVCLAGGLEHAERVLALPIRSGKAVLGLALTRLARHYGIHPRTQPRTQKRPPRLSEGRLRCIRFDALHHAGEAV